MGETAALPVIIEQVWDKDYEETVWRLRCPHCGRSNAFREVLKAVQWNETEEFFIVDGQIVSVTWSPAADAEFQHDRYECEACNKPVTMHIERERYQS